MIDEEKKEQIKNAFFDAAMAALLTLRDHAVNIGLNALINVGSKNAAIKMGAGKLSGSSRMLSARLMTVKDIDGRLISGPASSAYAKYSSRKPLPKEGEKISGRENDPHSLDDFNGKIEEGKYGAGEKRLLYKGNVIVKVNGDDPYVAKANIHAHDAKRAGLHYDYVFEGIKPGTKSFEINIPSGEFKGRYAIRPYNDELLFIRMKNEDVVLPKPETKLIDTTKLQQLDVEGDYIAEWKPDGGMSNVVIRGNRAIFTSHREQAPPYYDKIPWVEWLKNNSRLLTNRLLFKDPDLNGTVLQAELLHSDGAARTGGILNSGADKAIDYQQKNGAIKAYVFNIVKYKNKDVSHLPYQERRALYERVVSQIRHFNKFWEVVPSVSRAFVSFYQSVVRDPRGLPFSEGVVVKHKLDNERAWYKVKFRDTVDCKVVSVSEGTGKYAGTVGRILVETNGGGRGEVGSFQISDRQRQWMWDHRDKILGETCEIYAQDVGRTGAPRAGVFIRFHPSKSEFGLRMYSLDNEETLYALKSAAGWRRK